MISPTRLREIQRKLGQGHALLPAEVEELDAHIAEIGADPAHILNQYVAAIRSAQSETLGRVHTLFADVEAVDEAITKLMPTLDRLARAEADRAEAQAEEVRQRIASGSRLGDRLWSLVTAAVASKWLPAAGAALAAWLLARLGVAWSAP